MVIMNIFVRGKINAYKILMKPLRKGNHLECLDVNSKIIFKLLSALICHRVAFVTM